MQSINHMNSSSRRCQMDSYNKVSSNNYIHDDLSFYILSKLPIKSLKRFLCVRKSWSILFQNSLFMKMYRNHFISSNVDDDDSHHTFLFMHLPQLPDDTVKAHFHLLPPDHTFQNTLELNLPPPFQEGDDDCVDILCYTSVNGILCLKQNWLGGDKYKVQFVLWNPAIHEFVVVPPSPDQSGIRPLSLYTEYQFHGFGYDKLRDDFKVFQYVTFEWDSRYVTPIYRDPMFEIYSLTNNSWRILDIDMPFCYYGIELGRQLYLDGMCHFLLTNIEPCVMSFDLSDEVMVITPFDENFDDAISITPLDENSDFSIWKRRHLVVLNGSIALISNNDCDTTLQISILGELGVKESWIKLFIISPIPSFKWNLIGVDKKGYIFFRKEDGELAWLDLSTQIVEEIGVKAEDYNCHNIGIYKESLLSIRGLNN